MARRSRDIVRFPLSVERGYSRAVVNLTRRMGQVYKEAFDKQIKQQVTDYRQRYSMDADEIDVIIAILAAAELEVYEFFTDRVVEQIVTRHLRLLQTVVTEQGEKIARITGIDPTRGDDFLASFMRSSIRSNVGFITNIRDDYTVKIENIILDGARSGKSLKDIRDQLVEQIGMSEKRADFIARDQTGTIFGQLNARRQQNAGVKKFIWRDSADSRVRKLHKEFNGNTYSYSDPPRGLLPGEDYRCRCYAEPVFTEEDETNG